MIMGVRTRYRRSGGQTAPPPGQLERRPNPSTLVQWTDRTAITRTFYFKVPRLREAAHTWSARLVPGITMDVYVKLTSSQPPAPTFPSGEQTPASTIFVQVHTPGFSHKQVVSRVQLSCDSLPDRVMANLSADSPSDEETTLTLPFKWADVTVCKHDMLLIGLCVWPRSAELLRKRVCGKAKREEALLKRRQRPRRAARQSQSEADGSDDGGFELPDLFAELPAMDVVSWEDIEVAVAPQRRAVEPPCTPASEPSTPPMEGTPPCGAPAGKPCFAAVLPEPVDTSNPLLPVPSSRGPQPAAPSTNPHAPANAPSGACFFHATSRGPAVPVPVPRDFSSPQAQLLPSTCSGPAGGVGEAAVRCDRRGGYTPPPCSGAAACVAVDVQATVGLLPEAVLILVFKHLPTQAVRAAGGVCAAFRAASLNDQLWKQEYWVHSTFEDRHGAEGLIRVPHVPARCLPRDLCRADQLAAVEEFVVFPENLFQLFLEAVKKQKLSRDRERRLVEKGRRTERVLSKLRDYGPQLVAPAAVFFTSSCLALVVFELLDYTGSTQVGQATRYLCADLATLSLTIAVSFLCIFTYFANKEGLVFFTLLCVGITGTGVMMLQLAVRESVPYGWSTTTIPLDVCLVLCAIRFTLPGWSNIAHRLATFGFSMAAPLPIIATMYLAARFLREDEVECMMILWPIIASAGALLPWPPFVALFALVKHCHRPTMSWSKACRREFSPAFCAYLLYCVFVAFIFGICEGLCSAPQLGLTLLTILLSVLTIASFVLWETAIYGY
ncbi:hypothetical protein DIPPA_01484 [Diplonema papillatum]|nr:hypothetical protein DIPPA_01484 [Diplonema papillatum]